MNGLVAAFPKMIFVIFVECRSMNSELLGDLVLIIDLGQQFDQFDISLSDNVPAMIATSASNQRVVAFIILSDSGVGLSRGAFWRICHELNLLDRDRSVESGELHKIVVPAKPEKHRQGDYQ